MNRKRAKPGSPLSRGTSDEESLQHRSPHSNHGKKSSVRRSISHKIRLILAGDSSEDREGFTRLLQDIVGGIVLGTLGMSILLLLDYSNIINLETPRVVRKTASDMLNSAEIDEMMAEETDKKVISMDVYNAMEKELSDSKAVIKEEQKIFGARAMKETSMNMELHPLREEYEKLIHQAGLDVFCATCHWGMGMDCQQRVNYMMEQYSDSATVIGCIAKLVAEGKTKNGKCLTPQ